MLLKKILDNNTMQYTAYIYIYVYINLCNNNYDNIA